MTARDGESKMLKRCATAARDLLPATQDQKEANVFRLAAMVVQFRFSAESVQLMQVSDRYFAQYPNDKLAAVDVLRDRLSLQLRGA